MASVRERYEFYPRREAHGEGGGQIAARTIPPAVKAPKQASTQYIFSSMMSGHDDLRADHGLPDTPQEEADVMFRHIRQFVENAGGTPSDIVNLTFFTMKDEFRPLIDQGVATLADSSKWPTYHVVNVAPSGLRGERFEVVVTACVKR
jgi:enamine deaminase RidA (YjgF/YER057c/UK114 family)